MADILVLHLTSGEDIIGKARLDDQGANWLIENAVRPNVIVEPESGRARVALTPVIAYGESDKLVISTLHVTFTIPASEQMVNAYRQMLSGIVTPSAVGPPGPEPSKPSIKTLLHS